jgi:hypothetical protein
MIIKKYKPTVSTLEAVQVFPQKLTGKDVTELNNWLAPLRASCRVIQNGTFNTLYIVSEDSTHHAMKGDYIMCDFTNRDILVFDAVSFERRYKERID